jgi:hypothetical protein
MTMSKIETMIKNFIRFFFHMCLLHLETASSLVLYPFLAVAAEVGHLCLAVLPLLVDSWNSTTVHHVPLRHLSIDM